jgi:two-component sensor histidine kinase
MTGSSSDGGGAGTIVSNTGLVPLEEILCTENLWKRPARPPDHAAENRALSALAKALADSPSTILQSLAETVLTAFNAGSAGLSLLTKEGDRFYWAAIAGGWAPHLGGGTPRDFGPCGDVLDRRVPLLFSHWERRYPYLREATPLAEEALLVPFQVRGKEVGTIWAITHDERRRFDAEDLRQLQSLGRFAAAAHQAVSLHHDLDERERNEQRLQALVSELNHRVKNTLATVQSIAKHTLIGSDAGRCDVFEARLIALARTHDLLADSSWQDASLRHLIQQELKPYRSAGADNVVDGPVLAGPPRGALGLGMVFHALATNAAK